MKKITLIVSLIATTINLSGCLPPPHQMSVFNEKDFLPYKQNGTSSILGQAFLKTRGGEVRYGAGDVVTLIPATAYMKEILAETIQSDSLENEHPLFVVNINPNWKNYIREVTADGLGNFEFAEIPAGEYYLECPIFWEVPNGYSMEKTGSVVRKYIKVAKDEKLKVILTE